MRYELWSKEIGLNRYSVIHSGASPTIVQTLAGICEFHHVRLETHRELAEVRKVRIRAYPVMYPLLGLRLLVFGLDEL